MNACSEADQIPWVQTPENLQIELEGEDGIDAGSDIVIVEVDGQAVAPAQVWRAVRDGVARVRRGRASSCRRSAGAASAGPSSHENLRRAAERAAIEPAGAQIDVEAFAEDSEAGHRAILDGRRVRARPPLLPDARPEPRPTSPTRRCPRVSSSGR